jgi:hypothetical protein
LRQAYDYWQNQPGNYPQPWRRGDRGNPPKRAECMLPRWKEDAETPSVTSVPWHKCAGTASGYSIAPTEFPKNAVRDKASSGSKATRTRHIRLSGGEDLGLVDAKRRILSLAIPENLVKRLAKPAIYRLQRKPANRKR